MKRTSPAAPSRGIFVASATCFAAPRSAQTPISSKSSASSHRLKQSIPCSISTPPKIPSTICSIAWKVFFNFRQIADVQGWCFFRMLGTPQPAQERMMLFWHNRFATSASKVDQPHMMHVQMELFRQMGLGSFRDLLLAVGKDPAMLVWLDGQSNKKGHANENYGREVMELFTLGIGNYTEKDVQELARAFTGWQIQGQKAVLNPKLWDEGEKEIFGVKGPFNYEQAIDLLLKQPAASKHLATKLLMEFVNPNPLPEHVEHYASRLIVNDWSIRNIMREILTSRLFYSDWAYRSRIKSPIDLAVGIAVALGGKMNDDILTQATAKMGQNLLFPPNVKGWDGDQAWINANTLLSRFNFSLQMAVQRRGEFAEKPDLAASLKKQNVTTPDGVVDYFARMFLDGHVSPEMRKQLVDLMNHVGDPKAKPFALTPDVVNGQVRDIMHLMMATPEFQLA
jgi:uncharacterized protein (DUF1800 family)